MRSFILAGILSLITLIAAMPAITPEQASHYKYPWKNMTLSNLELVCARAGDNELYTCSLKFDFYDYNTEGVIDVNGAHCSTAWEWDGITPYHGPNNNFPNNYADCWSARGNIFMLKVVEFRSASQFEIYVSHLWTDPRFFTPPQNSRKAMVEIKIPDAHPSPPLAPYVPEVNQFKFIATATISRRTDGLS
ncbi:hypothetical protein CMUS01_00589 [Colletotrichum musicola]|uniref:Uncharacterized protein n=1 Tax=Colletotrichum musicola TaxID=2175873 RepID=A0A8H6NYS2_9PEZI|nr:hypothetical protein CMUS01_00589 [Colletotrichum musicola]